MQILLPELGATTCCLFFLSKLSGVLKEADEQHFVVTIQKKVKEEGAKRPKLVDEDLTFTYEEIKYTKYLISFK